MIGKVSNEAKKLVSDTKKALELGMASVIPYQSCVGDIGKAIETFAKAMGYSVVREFCGHGVGLAIHEDPYVFSILSQMCLLLPLSQEWSLQLNQC